MNHERERAWEDATGCSTPGDARRMVAALTAERDALGREHEKFLSRLHEALGTNDGAHGADIFKAAEELRRRAEEAERLRERVMALEARTWIQCTTASNECLGGCRSMTEHDRYAHGALVNELENLRPMVALHEDMTRQKREAESRLAAIRQRAQSRLLGPVEREVARFIVWDDDEQPPQTDDLDAVEQWRENQEAKADMTLDSDPRTFGDVEPPSTPGGPTTAEALATVRGACEKWVPESRPERGAALASIAFLDRRMGAMGRLAALVKAFPSPGDCGVDDVGAHEGCARCAWDDLQAAATVALTDAPPVFTLEEVRRATENPNWYHEPERIDEYRDGYEAALSDVRTRINALRK